MEKSREKHINKGSFACHIMAIYYLTRQKDKDILQASSSSVFLYDYFST